MRTLFVPKRELRGTDNVQGEISEHIFKVKWRLLCLLSFKYFSQNASRKHMLEEKVHHFKTKQTNKLYLTRVTLNSEITDKPVALGFQIEF